jgi:peptide/nickel transport system substrate-binding protein
MVYKALTLVMAALVVLSGCATAPAAAPTATTGKVAPTTAPATAGKATAPAASPTAAAKPAADTGPVPFRKDTATGAATPKRGGTLTTAQAGDITAWDPTKAQAIRVGHMPYTHSKLIQGDWTKGPHGTGQSAWEWGFLGDVSLLTGELAESWEMPDATTIIWNIRKGVKFHNKPPANGREVTAEDVAWNINMQFTYPGTWQAMSYPPSSGLAPTSIKAIDKYKVEVKVPAQSQGLMLLEMGGNMYTSPPEVWTSGGDMSDWTKVVGSSAWVLTDYTAGSAITFSRHPDYYEKDPITNQQLPYLDTYKILVIPDISTRLTALRTGKIDWLRQLLPDDAKQLMSSNKDLQWSRRIATSWVLSGRLDKPNLPFKDKRVRQAMNLAVDKQEILKNYFKGEGVLLGYPFPPTKSYEKYFTQLEQLPADVQELYTGYNPTKAKQLLAEAGYPNGFKAKVEVWSQTAQQDEIAMLANYLSKVGITLDIKVEEVGLWNSVDAANSHEEMWYGQARGIWAPFEMLMTKKGMYSNDAIIEDPYYDKVQEVVARDMVGNPNNYFKTMKDAGVYELQSAWGVFMPSPYEYNLWWPWMQNYYGINWTGWAGAWQWIKYVWTDQNMKKSMGY